MMEWSPPMSLQLNAATGAIVSEEITSPKLSAIKDPRTNDMVLSSKLTSTSSILELSPNGLSYQLK